MKRAASPGPILVTGASGYVGEHLCRRLIAAGKTVAGLWHTRPVALDGVRLRQADLRDPSATRALLADLCPRAIIHCAALTNVATCEQDPAAARAAIVAATGNLVAALAEMDLSARLVLVSTDLVFDGRSAPYRPTDPPSPVSVYGKAKREAELLVAAYARGVIVRSALVYGAPATHASSCLGWMLDTLRSGRELVVFEDEVRTPILVDDLAAALAFLAESNHEGVWHAGGPERLSRLTMGEIACAVFGLSRALLAPRRLAESTYAAPRPPDTSLESGALWAMVGHAPFGFRAALERVRAGTP